MANELPLASGCHCGAVRYSLSQAPDRSALCHCRDCQRSAGAPVVAWMLAGADTLAVEGDVTDFASSPGVIRQFCARCGTGLFYLNEAVFPGRVDIQLATLDDPSAAPAPSLQVQTAERLEFMARLHEMPSEERFPAA